MREPAVNTYTHNLGVTGLELLFQSLQARNLLGSSGCPIQRIEHQHDVFLPFELAEREFGSAQMAGQLEVRRLLADFNHDRILLSTKIERSDEHSLLSIGAEIRNSMQAQ